MNLVDNIVLLPQVELNLNESKVKIYGNICNVDKKTISTLSAISFIRNFELYIKGDFIFLISEPDAVYLGASRSAVIALYFRIINEDIVVSNKIKTVIKSSSINQLSSEAAYQFLTYEYVTDPLTLVKDVYKVPSSKTIRINNDKLCELIDVDLRLSDVKESSHSIRDFKACVYDAHEKRLAKSKNSLLLSGGIDSCTSAVVLRDLIGKERLSCYTFSTKGAEQDEYSDAEKTANHLDLYIERVVVDPNKEVDLESLIEDTNFFYPGSIMLSEIAKISGDNTNFFACQDTRLHTPALNPLDKKIFFATNFSRQLISQAAHLTPRVFPENSIADKIISRCRMANNLPEYLEKLFYHKHELNLPGFTSDERFDTGLRAALERSFLSFDGNARKMYNKVVELAWDRQYSDDIQYLKSTMNMLDSDCQLPWYDRDLAYLSASIPMKEATKYVKGRAGHSQKVMKVNKYVLRQAFEEHLPEEILFRAKAVCVTNHLYLKGVYKPYIEKMKAGAYLFDTLAGKSMSLATLFGYHYQHYLKYGIADYTSVVEMQNLVALELYCKIYNLS
jgi:asparagine synthetase B (glutamine-hydrolysing)